MNKEYFYSTPPNMKTNDILENKHQKGKNYYGNCRYCLQEVEWHSARAVNHALKCIKCPNDVRKESNSTKVANKWQKNIIVNSEVSSPAATFYTNSIADDIDEHERSQHNRMWVN